jgi:hypothetical protein
MTTFCVMNKLHRQCILYVIHSPLFLLGHVVSILQDDRIAEGGSNA